MAPPAPWQLAGSAFVVVVRRKVSLAALMLVRYRSSPVGPYDELLWCQPRRLSAGRRWSVGPIVVSSQQSVEGGRANWGISKHRADFDIIDRDDGVRATVRDDDGRVFADMHLRGRGPALPLRSGWLPRRAGVLAQERGGRYFTFRPEVRSRMRLASVRRLSTRDPFPVLGAADISLGFELCDFDMVFPVARERSL